MSHDPPGIRSRFVVASFALAMIGLSTSAEAQFRTPREAALAFALEHTGSFKVPRDSIVLVIDPNLISYSWDESTSGSRMTQDEARSEAVALARVIGPSVRYVSGSEHLVCERTSCATITRFSAVIVGQVGRTRGEGRWIVRLQLFEPGTAPENRTRSAADIEVTPQGGGWVGVSCFVCGAKQPVRIGG
jgi:hypothetical protein